MNRRLVTPILILFVSVFHKSFANKNLKFIIIIQGFLLPYLVINCFICSFKLRSVMRMNNVFCISWVSSTVVRCHFKNTSFFLDSFILNKFSFIFYRKLCLFFKNKRKTYSSLQKRNITK